MDVSMNRSWVGPLVTALIVVGVAAIFLLNREPAISPSVEKPAASVPPKGGTNREHPIGDEVVKNHIQVAAVWLNSVGMAGMPEPSNDVIHVEADIRATADNPNGFAKDEFVPYLKVKYNLVDVKSGKSLQSGEFVPMVANDGLHYGANIIKPAPGTYRLDYMIDPPSAGGLGRHSDPATGVAPWWEPFTASFDWVMEPEAAGARP
jgi:uncharacterized protein involved in high-affinity Fe2+ transport